MNSIQVFAAIVVIISVSVMFRNSQQKISQLQRTSDYYAKTYLCKQGGTSLWKGSNGKMIDYDLRSFDEGRTWYAVRQEGELGEYLKILGEVESIYPGLMEHLKKMDALTDYVEKNGPLKTREDIQMLEGIGFNIRTN